MTNPRIFTVILNTNRREDTLACLASLARSSYPANTVIVLDNASTDGSVQAIGAAFPEVQVIALQANLGYAGNNNVGIRAALAQGADWVFVLNEDTILHERCLETLVRVGESDPSIGMVGPLVYHYDEPTVIQSAGGMLTRFWEAKHLGMNQEDRRQFTRPYRVDYVSGCALLVRRALVEQVGAIDERFFYYWEETEWCMRAARAGWQLLLVPEAKLWHKGVQRDYRPKPGVAYYNTRNRLLLMAKHRASFATWFGATSQIARTMASMSIRPKYRPLRRHRDAMVRGTFDFLRQRWGQGPF